MSKSKIILPIIVISQFFCTSLWFAGNGVMSNLVETFHLEENALSLLTSAVQFGFITGTLVFALFTIADRFSPSKVFFISAFFGALFNIGFIFENQTLVSLISLRFLTGFFLAGIYPVGMKIATDYYQKGLGKSLGFLVGALVLGTALPHLLKDILIQFTWKSVLIATSSLALIGGLLMLLFVKNGPFRKPSTTFDVSICFHLFKNINFRKAAFGYFGHMWELYTFWAFVPILLITYQNLHPEITFNISILSFVIISSGSISCVIGGYISQKIGIRKTAFGFLLLSCICCIAAPFLFQVANESLFIAFLLFWGMVVIGFSITIISIQIISSLFNFTNSNLVFSVLAIGPIFGLISLRNKTI